MITSGPNAREQGAGGRLPQPRGPGNLGAGCLLPPARDWPRAPGGLPSRRAPGPGRLDGPQQCTGSAPTIPLGPSLWPFLRVRREKSHRTGWAEGLVDERCLLQCRVCASRARCLEVNFSNSRCPLCHAGAPPPTLRWYKDAVPVGPLQGPRYRALPGGGLRIQQLQPSDSGIFQCFASNDGGEVQTRTYLAVTSEYCPPAGPRPWGCGRGQGTWTGSGLR